MAQELGQQTALALRLDPATYNVVVPTLYTEDISPYLRLVVQEIRVNPDPTFGDVHYIERLVKLENGESKILPGFQLTAAKVFQFAAAANIQINYRESGIIVDTPTRVGAACVGAIQDATGEWRILRATKTLDLEQLKTSGLSEKQVRQKWLFRYEFVETGARLRFIRAALGLKTVYGREEISKPFAIVRVTPRLEDPNVRQAMLRRALASSQELFGAGRPAAAALGPASASVVDIDAGEADDGLPEGNGTLPPCDAGEAGPAHPAPPTPPPPLAAGGTPAPATGVAPGPAAATPPASASAGAPAPSGGLFPQGAAPAAAAAGKRPAGCRPPGGIIAYCEGCGVGVTAPTVVEYSNRVYGRVLCRDCQNALKRAQGGALA